VCATILRDAFFYIPMSRIAYRQLQREKELVCDEQVVHVTKRPVALASPLSKLWLHAAEHSWFAQLSVKQSLVEADSPLNHRIERLLESKQVSEDRKQLFKTSLNICLFALGALVLVQIVNLVITLVLLHCDPTMALESLF
jgi:beta-lactamase regulating signal transducer with metallopeptidase domain